MEFIQILSQASIVAILSILVSLFPAGFGVAFALKPTEQRLAMMRPISLAALFAGLGGFVLGLINSLRMVWTADPQVNWRIVAVGTAESLVTLFVAFGALTLAWLCVAIGFRRQSSASNPV